MINAIVCLMGPGGVGKLTIGRVVAERLGCRLVDNHYWLNPIFGLIEQDGVTPLPQIVWPLVEQVVTPFSTRSPRSHRQPGVLSSRIR
jgi:hypothetical protein